MLPEAPLRRWCFFFSMRGMHNNLVVKVHYRPLRQDLIANTRGVHREVESGGSWTHISSLTNVNHIQGVTRWTSLPNRAKMNTALGVECKCGGGMGWKWLRLSVEVSLSGYEVELRRLTKPHGDMRVGDEARRLVFGHQGKTHEKAIGLLSVSDAVSKSFWMILLKLI